eukprot:1131537-Pleurochrysis_carterae.AAC.2
MIVSLLVGDQHHYHFCRCDQGSFSSSARRVHVCRYCAESGIPFNRRLCASSSHLQALVCRNGHALLLYDMVRKSERTRVDRNLEEIMHDLEGVLAPC